MTAASSPMPQGTVTFLFTDIEGSTELARRLGADFGSLRAEHRRVLREAFSVHDGHEIDTAGDGFFVVFERAGDAVGAALAAQRAVAGLEEPLHVRMGLHTAEPHLGDDGYVGVGVHRAARVCAAGHGGQILLSAATAGILEDLELEGERPRDALRAALAAREAIRHDPWVTDEHRCALKCGIHSSRIVSVQPGQLGSAAAYVIRLCDTAEPWQILVSYATEALLEGDAPEFELEDFGERTLAGRDRPDRVFGLPA